MMLHRKNYCKFLFVMSDITRANGWEKWHSSQY